MSSLPRSILPKGSLYPNSGNKLALGTTTQITLQNDVCGITATTGPQGPTGKPGLDGKDGEQGQDGTNGATGATGPTGPSIMYGNIDTTLTNKKISFTVPSAMSITATDILAKIDNTPSESQIYTFGKTIPNRWVAVGPKGPLGNAIAYSSDGINWSPANSTLGVGSGVAWNGSMWVAVGSGANSIVTSSDGISWSPANNFPFSVKCLIIVSLS
jgi:hypothetical protein